MWTISICIMILFMIVFVTKKVTIKNNSIGMINNKPIFDNLIGSYPIDNETVLLAIKTNVSILIYSVLTSFSNGIQLICISVDVPNKYALVTKNNIKYLTLYFLHHRQVDFYFDVEKQHWMHIEDIYNKGNLDILPDAITVQESIH